MAMFNSYVSLPEGPVIPGILNHALPNWGEPASRHHTNSDFQTKMVIYRPINQVVAIVCLGWSKPLNNGDEQMSSSNHQNMGDGTDAKQCEVDIPSSNRFTIEWPRYPPKRRCSCCFSMLSLSLSSCLWNTNFTKQKTTQIWPTHDPTVSQCITKTSAMSESAAMSTLPSQ